MSLKGMLFSSSNSLTWRVNIRLLNGFSGSAGLLPLWQIRHSNSSFFSSVFSTGFRRWLLEIRIKIWALTIPGRTPSCWLEAVTKNKQKTGDIIRLMVLLDNATFLRALRKLYEENKDGSVFISFKGGSEFLILWFDNSSSRRYTWGKRKKRKACLPRTNLPRSSNQWQKFEQTKEDQHSGETKRYARIPDGPQQSIFSRNDQSEKTGKKEEEEESSTVLVHLKP